MYKEEINTTSAPEALGPYSQAIQVGDFVFTSGQIPINPETGEIPDEISSQAKQSLENVKAVLEAAGTSLSEAIKVTVFIKDMNDFSKINEVYANYFAKPYPARSCVEVARLPKDVLVEIEAIALKK